MIHQPIPRPLDRINPRSRSQVKVQQPRHRRLPLTRRLLVPLRASTRVEAYEVVVPVPAGRRGLQERRVDEGLQQVLRVLDRKVQHRRGGRHGDVRAVGEAQEAERARLRRLQLPVPQLESRLHRQVPGLEFVQAAAFVRKLRRQYGDRPGAPGGQS